MLIVIITQDRELSYVIAEELLLIILYMYKWVKVLKMSLIMFLISKKQYSLPF